MGARAAVQHAHLHLVVAQLFQGLLHGLHAALHVRLDNQVQGQLLALLNGGKQVLHGHLGHGGFPGRLELLPALVRHLTAELVVAHGNDLVARGGHVIKAHDLHRRGGTRGFHALATVVDHSPHTAGGQAGDDVVAHVQGTVLHQHGGQGTAGFIQLGLDNDATAQPVGIGAQLHHVRLQEDHFQQLIHAHAGLGADGHHDGLAAPVLAHHVVLGELLLDLVGIGAFLVHFVDGNNDGHLGGLGMVDGLNGLGHHAVVGGHHQHGDVRSLGAPGAHGGKRLMAGRIQEGDGAAVDLHGIGADCAG